MNHDNLEHADLLELLLDGPVGDHRRWAGLLILRMLDPTGAFGYLHEARLGGRVHAQSAMASLRAAGRVLSESEQALLLRTVLVTSWEALRRATGLSLRVPEIFDGFGRELGIPPSRAAAQSVIEQGELAVRRFPLEGLLPEVRRPGEGLIVTLDAADQKMLGVSVESIEFDRLAVAVQNRRRWEWPTNLRPLVPWWLKTLERKEAHRAARGLFPDLRRAIKDEPARWRALGLLDWLADHPDHPMAGEAMAVAREVARADVRKAAADLAAALGRWEVLEGLVRSDRDRGVRHRAETLLASGKGSGWTGGQGQLFG